MAYDVIKTIAGREYRYRVQSERDAQTGKTRNRWTYIGRVASEREAVRAPVPRRNARIRLLKATEALLESGDGSALTVDAIAARAGVAHGTFYRYFRDRSDVLRGLAQYIRETHGIGDDQLLRDDVRTRAQARAGVRRWVVEKLRSCLQLRRSIRAWHALIASDARLAAYREERRESTVQRLREHLRYLTASGFAAVDDPDATAATLIALCDGVVRATILESDSLDESHIEAVAQCAERTIFARL